MSMRASLSEYLTAFQAELSGDGGITGSVTDALRALRAGAGVRAGISGVCGIGSAGASARGACGEDPGASLVSCHRSNVG